MNKQKAESLSREIRNYLSGRPGAEDTFEGIVSWWVRADKGEHSLDELTHVLDLLVAKGEIRKTDNRQDVIVYTLEKHSD